MARVPMNPAAQQAVFNESLKPGGGTTVFKTAAGFAETAPKQRRYKRKDFSSLADRAIREVELLIQEAKESADPASVWKDDAPEQALGLYAVMHQHVYGVLPGELAGDWMAARSAVVKLVKDEFGGRMVGCVEYLQWAFAREKKNEAKRSGGSGWRLGWRWAFMKRDLITDFRLARQRSSRSG